MAFIKIVKRITEKINLLNLFGQVKIRQMLVDASLALSKILSASAKLISVMSLVFSTMPMHYAYANPQDGIVSSGSAAISASGNSMVIDQYTQKVVIDWRSFNIAADESVRFNQLSSSSIALNRINDVNPSTIFGSLSANGKIILLNPNGILFGAGSRIDVNSIIATTANISNEDFMAGNMNFRSDLPFLNGLISNPDASIINQGTINARDAGLVGLVAPNVINSGIINARFGKVHLASGDRFTLDLYGDGLINIAASDQISEQLVQNTGNIDAKGGIIQITASAGRSVVNSLIDVKGSLDATSVEQKDGKIIIKAEGSNGTDKDGQSTVLVSGDLDVSNNDNGKGGTIDIGADRIAILDGANIKADGASGGGTIRIGGDYQGQVADGDLNPFLQNAARVIIQENSNITANALDKGNGGRVIIWADDKTMFAGNIEAKGGINGGDGGFVETSGKNILTAIGNVDASAQNVLGNKGQWLLDPNNITIQASGTNTRVTGSPNFTTTDDSAIVTTGSIQSALNGGTDVTILTSSAGSNTQAGDITVNDSITKTAGGDATLTLRAINNINLSSGANIGSTSNKLNVVLNSNINGTNNLALINTNGATINTNGGAITFSGNLKLQNSLNIDTRVGTSTTAGAATFSGTIDGTAAGAQNLTINTGAANISISGNIGNNVAIGALNITSATTVINNATSIKTQGGAVSFNTSLSLRNSLTIDTTNSGVNSAGANIDTKFIGAITTEGQNLTTNAGTAGITTFDGVIGGAIALGDLNSISGGGINFKQSVTAKTITADTRSGAGDITTGGFKTVTATATAGTGIDFKTSAGSIKTNGDTIQTSGSVINIAGKLAVQTGTLNIKTNNGNLSGGNIIFGDTINGFNAGGYNMVVNAGTSGSVTFNGIVGGTTSLGTFNTIAGGGVNFNQNVRSRIIIASTSAGTGNINIGANKTITAIATTGTGIDFTTSASGSIVTNGGTIRTSNGTINFGGDLKLTSGNFIAILTNNGGVGGGNITFQNINSTNSTSSATAYIRTGTAGKTVFNGDVGNINRLQDLDLISGGGIDFNQNVTANAINADTSSGVGNINIGANKTITAASTTGTGISFVTSASGSINTNGGTIQTAGGSINFSGALKVATGALNINTNNGNILGGNINFNNAVDGAVAGAQNLIVYAGTAGTTTFNGAVGGTTALGTLSTTSGGGINFNQNVTANTITADTSSGVGNINIGANKTIAAAATSGSGITLSTSASGSINTNGGTIQTAGGTININGALKLANAALNINTNNVNTLGGNINFAGTIDGAQNLTITAGTTGATTFNGAVGGTTALGTLSTTSGGGINLNNNITTAGNITFNNAVNLSNASSSTVTINTNNGNVNFNGAVDGNKNLTVNSVTGTATFNGDVGQTTALGALSVTSATITGTATSIKTQGGTVNLAGNLALQNSLTIDTTNSGVNTAGADITFGGTINGAQNLTTNAGTSGTTAFNGSVGGTTAVGNLSVTGATITGTTTSIKTQGGTVNLAGNLALQNSLTIDTTNSGVNTAGADITFGGTINGAQNLTTNAGTSGTTAFNGSVGGTIAVADLSVVSGGGINFNENVTANKIIADTSSGVGNITLGSSKTITSTATNGTGIDLKTSTFGSINANGGTIQTAGGTINIGGALKLANAALNIKTNNGNAAGGNIIFAGTIDGAQDLTTNAGTTGITTFNGVVGGTTALGALSATSGGGINFNENVKAGTIFADTTSNNNGDIQIGGTLNAISTSGIVGTSSIILTSGRNFINNSGNANPFINAGSTRSLIYSSNPDADSSLSNTSTTKPTKRYNKTYLGYNPASVTETGNVFLYSVAPVLNVTADNATTTYGTAPTLTIKPITGMIDGDLVADLYSDNLTLTSSAVNVGTYNGIIDPGIITAYAQELGYDVVYGRGDLVIEPIIKTDVIKIPNLINMPIEIKPAFKVSNNNCLINFKNFYSEDALLSLINSEINKNMEEGNFICSAN